MAFLSSILSAAGTVINEPSWLWEKIILHVFDFIANYGWRVVVFTLCLKLLLSPLDIYQRYKARKNQRITEKLKPQMEKLQKQYPDKTIFAQKQMQLKKQADFFVFFFVSSEYCDYGGNVFAFRRAERSQSIHELQGILRNV